MFRFTTVIVSVAGVTNFVNAALKAKGDVTLSKGRFIVDGKSIMGIYSIDPSSGFTVELSDDADRELFTDYIKEYK